MSVGEIIHACEHWKYMIHCDTENNVNKYMQSFFKQIRFALNRDYFKLCFSYITTTLQTLAYAHEITFDVDEISTLDFFYY